MLDLYLGLCRFCNCSWSSHRHITYEYLTDQTRFGQHVINNSSTTQTTITFDDIDQRINQLRYEAEHIQTVYKKLAEFLHSNAMLPFNDAVIEYLQYFIQEEQTKQNSSADNQQVINQLQTMTEDFRSHIKLIEDTIKSQTDSGKQNKSQQQPKDVANLIQSLYDLPIMGIQLRDQVKSIMIGQEVVVNKHERVIDLPTNSNCSKVMQQLCHLIEEITI